VSAGQIFLIDPKHPQAEPPIIAQFPNGSCTCGITEVDDDVFYTAGALGDVYEFAFKPNTSSVWEVDMRAYAKTGKSSVRKVLDIPLAQVPNGMTLLSKEEGIILIADSAGAIWKVDVYKGTYEIFFDDPLLKPIPTSFPSFGVNGIRIVDGPTSTSNLTLYFTNTNHGYLGTIPISPETGTPAGPAVLLSENVPDADDFAVDSCGNVWLCENVKNTLVRVSPDGSVQTITGGQNSTALVGPVSARFGRGSDDRDVLYVSTDGLTFDLTTGVPLTTNGMIAAIDTRGL
jgi:hypothetical protein